MASMADRRCASPSPALAASVLANVRGEELTGATHDRELRHRQAGEVFDADEYQEITQETVEEASAEGDEA